LVVGGCDEEICLWNAMGVVILSMDLYLLVLFLNLSWELNLNSTKPLFSSTKCLSR